MKQLLFPLIQLGFVAAWAIMNDLLQPPLAFVDTTEMAQQGELFSKIQLVASFDPETALGRHFIKEIASIQEEFIAKGFVCYFERKEAGEPLCIYINGQDKTQEILTKDLRSCLSMEYLKEI